MRNITNIFKYFWNKCNTKKIKNVMLWTSITVWCLLAIVIASITTSLFWLSPASGYKLFFYAINYFEFGFLKRALVGSIYHLFFDNIERSKVLFFISITFILFILTSIYYFYKIKLHNHFIFILFLLSPGTLIQFIADFGRTDILLVTTFMLAIISSKRKWLFFLINCIGILIHEIYILAYLPAAFMYYLSLDSEKIWVKNVKNSIVLIFCSKLFYIFLATILVIIAFGNYHGDYNSFVELTSSKLNQLPYQITDHAATYVLFRNSLENIFFNFAHLKQLSSLIMFTQLVICAITLSLVLIYLRLLGVIFLNNAYTLIILSALPMFIIGYDFQRWIAMILNAIFLIFIALEPDKARKVDNPLLLIPALSGPMGVYLPIVLFFPHIAQYLYMLIQTVSSIPL